MSHLILTCLFIAADELHHGYYVSVFMCSVATRLPYIFTPREFIGAHYSSDQCFQPQQGQATGL